MTCSLGILGNPATLPSCRPNADGSSTSADFPSVLEQTFGRQENGDLSYSRSDKDGRTAAYPKYAHTAPSDPLAPPLATGDDPFPDLPPFMDRRSPRSNGGTTVTLMSPNGEAGKGANPPHATELTEEMTCAWCEVNDGKTARHRGGVWLHRRCVSPYLEYSRKNGGGIQPEPALGGDDDPAA
jgi:hypothetical protein